MDPITGAPGRKLVLAVADERLRKKLEELMREENVEVEHVPNLAGVDPSQVDADLVVLRSSTVEGDELPRIIEGGDAQEGPGVVFLGDEGEAEEEIRLVAGGATAVLDTSVDRAELADQLVELAEAEADGGVHGPEGHGSLTEPKLADFQSRSPRMRDFLDVVWRVAASDSTLLITGETGVGKERLAQAIHAESARSKGPFVVVNCGALAESLLESELFGHHKGAFTGATGTHKGHFESANGGTIFLDEIAEMPQHLQVKLLTVLQRHEVQPIGASKPVGIDVRVIAATNRDLAADVSEKRFRQDLFFRLNVVSLVIPPLRERIEDVPWFVGRFLKHFVESHRRPTVQGITRQAVDILLAYSWPGNVRELVNVIERGVLLCKEERIRPEDLPEALRQGGGPALQVTVDPTEEFLELPLQEARRRIVEHFEQRYLEHHLRACHGTVGEVAERACINPRTLYEKMRRLGLAKEDFR